MATESDALKIQRTALGCPAALTLAHELLSSRDNMMQELDAEHAKVMSELRSQLLEAQREEAELEQQLLQSKRITENLHDTMSKSLEEAGLSMAPLAASEDAIAALNRIQAVVESAKMKSLHDISSMTQETTRLNAESSQLEEQIAQIQEKLDSEVQVKDKGVRSAIIHLNFFRYLGVKVVSIDGKEKIYIYNRTRGTSTTFDIDETHSKHQIINRIWELFAP